MGDSKLDEVNYIFNLAVEQYANINLVFLLDKCPYSTLSAVCVGLKNNHVITRVPLEEIERHPVIWGSEVSGYFSVRDTDIINCHFKTRLVRIYNAPPNSMFLIFPLPRFLDHNQRRFSRRVNIDEEYADSFRLYHAWLSGGDNDHPPQYKWQLLNNHGCELAELSATGMRIDMNEQNPLYAKIFLNDPVLLKGDFGYAQKPAKLYVLGNVVRKMRKPDSEDMMSIGCHFESWRKTEANSTWFRADPQEGIAQIAQWVARTFRSLNT